ncbi:MAG: GNAT family N-acetyltransferase, partial [Cucumibacter sp.]
HDYEPAHEGLREAICVTGCVNWREYWMNAWTSPRLMRPLATRNPPTTATAFMGETRDGELAGNVGFHERHEGMADIGYYLGRPFWGRGLMTEAVRAALDWYFGETGAGRVGSGVFHFNAPSLAIQRKLGFVETGRSLVHCLARGKDIEQIDTELTRATHAALSR